MIKMHMGINFKQLWHSLTVIRLVLLLVIAGQVSAGTEVPFPKAGCSVLKNQEWRPATFRS